MARPRGDGGQIPDGPSRATRADRAAANWPGAPPEAQHCANCQFVQGEGEWVGCTLFPGKAVYANGWCMS